MRQEPTSLHRAWKTLPGGSGLVLGILARPLMAQKVLRLISSTSGWNKTVMWEPAQIAHRAPACTAVCAAPASSEIAEAIDRVQLISDLMENPPPTVWYAPHQGAQAPEGRHRLGLAGLTPVCQGLEDSRLQDAIVDAVLRPGFHFVGDALQTRTDVDPTLRFVLQEAVSREVPHFDVALAMIQSGRSPFVRHVTDIVDLTSYGRTWIEERAHASDIRLGTFCQSNVALHGIARYEADSGRAYRLARRLGLPSAAALGKLITRTLGAGLHRARRQPFGVHAAKLLSTFAPTVKLPDALDH